MTSSKVSLWCELFFFLKSTMKTTKQHINCILFALSTLVVSLPLPQPHLMECVRRFFPSLRSFALWMCVFLVIIIIIKNYESLHLHSLLAFVLLVENFTFLFSFSFLGPAAGIILNVACFFSACERVFCA